MVTAHVRTVHPCLHALLRPWNWQTHTHTLTHFVVTWISTSCPLAWTCPGSGWQCSWAWGRWWWSCARPRCCSAFAGSAAARSLNILMKGETTCDLTMHSQKRPLNLCTLFPVQYLYTCTCTGSMITLEKVTCLQSRWAFCYDPSCLPQRFWGLLFANGGDDLERKFDWEKVKFLF